MLTAEGHRLAGLGSDSQAHGKSTEISIQKCIFHMRPDIIALYSPTAPYDIEKKHNTLEEYESLRGKNISIKVTLCSIICCGKITRFILDISPNSETVMIVSHMEQINKEQKLVKRTSIISLSKLLEDIDEGELSGFKGKVEEFENYVRGLPKGDIGNEYLKRAKDIENEYPEISWIIKINPKVDSKSQRRVQCSINMKHIGKDAIESFEGSKIYDTEYCGLISSPPRDSRGVTINLLKQFAKSKGIKGRGKRGGWTNMKKGDILDHILKEGMCSEENIINFQGPC